jgi:hypothetical protein
LSRHALSGFDKTVRGTVFPKPASEGVSVEPALRILAHDRQIDQADEHNRSADVFENGGGAGKTGVNGDDLHRASSLRET